MKKQLKRFLEICKKKQNIFKNKKIIIRIILSVFVIIFLYSVFVLKPLYHKAKAQVYDILADMDTGTFRRQNNTTIYDKNGELIGKLGYEHYEYVEITKISDKIQQGYIDVEDKRFKTHPGIDIRSMIRALFVYIKNGGRITQGGSTITQQVIKNNLLTQERSFHRKLLEILIAFQLEKEYTKADIMEFYCNSNYYGNNCYGVQGAAEYYFGTDANSLDWAQAAIIIGTSNSPNRYNPIADYELCMQKKERVLKTIYEAGHITEEEYKKAVEERPEIVRKNESVGSESYVTSYAVYCSALKLMEKNGFAFQYTFDSQEEYENYRNEYSKKYNEYINDIRDGGYKIETSFDTEMQELLQNAVDESLQNEQLKQEDDRYDTQAAAICIDNDTGQVLAIVGGRGTKESFNRGYQAKRQAGSVIKPLLVYGPALNEGMIIPATIYEDKEIDINGYRPENGDHEYWGEMTIREALARSVNTIAVQVFRNVGTQTALSYLDKLRFSTLCYGDAYNMAVSLGGFTKGVTVCDIARGYATIVNDGYMKEGGCLNRIISERDGTIYEYNPSNEVQVYTEDTAFMLRDMMQGVFKREDGTAHEYDTDEQIYAGKTGTTNDGRDAWFSGFSSYYTCTVWVGSDTSRVIENLTGSGYPLQIWNQFMQKIHENLEKKEFNLPDTIQLTNGEDNMDVDYFENIYESRPEDWDYTSSTLKVVMNEKERQERIIEEVENAEEAVRKFEEFQINSIEDVARFDEMYQETLSVISEIEDNDKQSNFKERAEVKYALLSGDVKENWKDADLAIEEAQQAQILRENQEEAVRSAEEALQTTHDNRIYAVSLYIEYLNDRSVYTSHIEDLITKAKEVLNKCHSYEEYEDLKYQLEASIERVRQLPREDDVYRESNQASEEVTEAENEVVSYPEVEVFY